MLKILKIRQHRAHYVDCGHFLHLFNPFLEFRIGYTDVLIIKPFVRIAAFFYKHQTIFVDVADSVMPVLERKVLPENVYSDFIHA